MSDLTIQSLEPLTLEMLRPLLDESLGEGYEFVDRLWREYEAGVNRFDGVGEALLGVFEDNRLIAIGGLHQDLYLADDSIGRIRHVYVLNAYRGQGVGRRLMAALIDAAQSHYHTLTLRTMTSDAAAFYSAIGFEPSPRLENASHWMALKPLSNQDG
jgi:GNAT superfamily N-acetyltransferase